MLAGLDRAPGPRPGPRSTPARPSRRPRASAADRKHLILTGGQPLLQAAVDVDPDQLEVLAVVRAADAARVAVPARLQRPYRDALAGRQLRAAVRPDAPRSCRRPRGPARAGTASRRPPRTARRRRSGSPSRRSRSPRGAITTSPGPGSAARAVEHAPSPRRRSVTAARIAGRSAPDLGRRLDDQRELGDLLLVGERVALDGRGEAALRRQAELLDRRRTATPPRSGA